MLWVHFKLILDLFFLSSTSESRPDPSARSSSRTRTPRERMVFCPSSSMLRYKSCFGYSFRLETTTRTQWCLRARSSFTLCVLAPRPTSSVAPRGVGWHNTRRGAVSLHRWLPRVGALLLSIYMSLVCVSLAQADPSALLAMEALRDRNGHDHSPSANTWTRCFAFDHCFDSSSDPGAEA